LRWGGIDATALPATADQLRLLQAQRPAGGGEPAVITIATNY